MNKIYIKNISIRGRYAIAITCLKLLLREKGLIQDLFYRKLIDKLGEFTSAERLDIWEREILIYFSNMSADEIICKIKELNNKHRETRISHRGGNWYGKEYKLLETNFYERLAKFLTNKENKEIIKIIDLSIEIGRSELYGQMSNNNSSSTNDLLKEILELTNVEDEFNFKKIAEEYPFSEERGWGKTFDFNTFKRK